MRYRRNNEPREITVKFPGKCAETGRELKKGDRAVYYPDSKDMFHPDSKQAYEFRNMKADDILCGS